MTGAGPAGGPDKDDDLDLGIGIPTVVSIIDTARQVDELVEDERRHGERDARDEQTGDAEPAP